MKPQDKLRELVSSIQPITEEEWEDFSKLWTLHSCKRKEQITVPGQVEKNLYFVVEGVQRVFYYDDQNREATLVFTYNPSFGGVLDSMMKRAPSKYYYETLTPSIFLKASFNDVQELAKKYSNIDSLIKTGLVQALSGVLERLVEVQCYSSEDRFKILLKRSPHILHLVPHKYIATYLGIDPTNFSKMINKVRI